MGVTYSECASVALGIRHAIRMRHTAICGLSGGTVFLHIISKTARFLKKLKVLNKNVWFWISLQICVKHFLLCEAFSQILP